jgi:hypothetical protein
MGAFPSVRLARLYHHASDYANSNSASISTGTLNGNAPTPIATREWSPISGPNTFRINDDAPFISSGNSVKSGTDETMP